MVKGVMHYIADDLGGSFALDHADAWLGHAVDSLVVDIERSRDRHERFERFLRAQGIE